MTTPYETEHLENTQWLLNYAQDAIAYHGAKWSDYVSGEYLRTTYEDDRDGDGGPGGYVTVGPRGLDVLDAAVRGEDYTALMVAWENEIYG